MQLGNCIVVFLARHVSGAYTHHQENYTLSCSIWYPAPSFWMGGGLESRFVWCGWCCTRHHPHRTKNIRCNSTSNTPDDGHMRSKYVQLRTHQ